MNREFLKDLELEKDVIDKVMAEHGKTVNDIKQKADKVDTLESQIEDYQKQLGDRDDQLQSLSDQVKDNKELQDEIKKLQDENKRIADDTAKDYEDKLASQQKEFAIKSALQQDNVHDVDLAIKALDLDSINFKDDKLIGYDEQRDNLKENKAFLFKEEGKLGGRDPHPSNPNETKEPTKNPFKRGEHFNLTEQARIFKEDPELAKQLQAKAKG